MRLGSDEGDYYRGLSAPTAHSENEGEVPA